MRAASPWIVRAGVLLAVVSLFVRQAELPGGDVWPWDALRDPGTSFLARLWAMAPVLAALPLLLPPGRAFGRAAVHAILLAAAFAEATWGSILLTAPDSGSSGAASSALAMALFVVPVAGGGAVLARLAGGSAPLATAALSRLLLGVLLVLGGLILPLTFDGTAVGVTLLAGAWTPVAAGALVVAGEAAGLVRSPHPAPVPA